MLTVYGIKNCDTCRKALKWLSAEGIDHTFHDFRVDGLDAANVTRWAAAAGWEKLLNRRGTTWRNLPESDKDGVDAASAEVLMARNPTLIKRPVFDDGSQILVGFTAAEQEALKA
ncbi:MAG: ArsC family reductase [Rhodospirillaceae bacterium]|nr:ArsC family reductase [Rhodospirillaceae bacterium]